MLARFLKWLRSANSTSSPSQTYEERLAFAVQLLRQGREGVQRWNALKASGQLNPPPPTQPPGEILAALKQALEHSVDMGNGIRTVNLRNYMETPPGGWNQALHLINDIEADALGPDIPSTDLKNLDLTDADFSFCNTVACDFSGSVMDGAKFTKANLTLARFVGSRAHYALFHSAYLSSADLTDADLYHASFSRANLQEACLVNANLTEADLSMARLLRADLRGAIVERAIVKDLHVQELLNPPNPPETLFLAPGRGQLRPEDARHVFHSGWKTRFASKNVFISYRRSDSAEIAHRFFLALSSSLGEERVFLDRATIPIGADDFEAEIEQSIRHTTLLLLLIGKQWDIARLATQDDHVRREIEQALAVDATFLPVLIGDAAMPDYDEIPPSIQRIARIQAAGPVPVNAQDDEIGSIVEIVHHMMES